MEQATQKEKKKRQPCDLASVWNLKADTQKQRVVGRRLPRGWAWGHGARCPHSGRHTAGVWRPGVRHRDRGQYRAERRVVLGVHRRRSHPTCTGW